MPFERGASATDLESSGVLEEQSLESVLPCLGVRSEAECSLKCMNHMTPKKEQLGSLLADIPTSIHRFRG